MINIIIFIVLVRMFLVESKKKLIKLILIISKRIILFNKEFRGRVDLGYKIGFGLRLLLGI